MSVLRHWKIILCMGAIFVVGAVTGGALTLRAVHSTVLRTLARNGLFGDWASTTMKRFQARLKLRPEQVQKIQPILEDTGRELKATTREAFAQVVSITVRSNDQVAKELDSDQRLIFEKMNEETRRHYLQMQRSSAK
jgi:uncharacterized membrane protein